MSVNKEVTSFIDKIIFKKYKISKLIGEGVSSNVYHAININNNDNVAIKIEEKLVNISVLENEAYIVYKLNNIGFPKFITYGKVNNSKVLVESYLGKSLFEIFYQKNKEFNYKDMSLACMQTLDRLEYLHSLNYIHRDMKPQNLLFGFNDPNTLYLIDFGITKKYRSTKTGKHISFRNLKKFNGTAFFASVNSLDGYELSRKDDLISLGYIALFLLGIKLPWQIKHQQGETKNKFYEKIKKIKEIVSAESLCKNVEMNLYKYIKYVYNLKFEEDPNYSYLRNLFLQIYEKYSFNTKELKFSWIYTRERYINSEKAIIKKQSFHTRLFNQISKTLSKEKEKLNRVNEISQELSKNTYKEYSRGIMTKVEDKNENNIETKDNNTYKKLDCNSGFNNYKRLIHRTNKIHLVKTLLIPTNLSNNKIKSINYVNNLTLNFDYKNKDRYYKNNSPTISQNFKTQNFSFGRKAFSAITKQNIKDNFIKMIINKKPRNYTQMIVNNIKEFK